MLSGTEKKHSFHNLLTFEYFSVCWIFFQLPTNVKAISGSVQISGVSLSRGSAMVRMTVVTNQMRTLPTAPPGRVALDNSSAATDAASHRAGNVMLMMIVVTIQMNH